MDLYERVQSILYVLDCHGGAGHNNLPGAFANGFGECIIALGCRQRLHVKAISDRFGGGGNDRPIMPDPALNRAKTRGASVET